MADKTATYSVKTESNAKEVGEEGAAALEALRKVIESSKSAIKDYGESLRNLRGSTDEVKAAKEKLKAGIESERNAISGANLALIKQGSSFEKLASQSRQAAASQKSFNDAFARATKLWEGKQLEQVKDRTAALEKSMGAAGGPVEAISGRLTTLKTALSTGAGAMALFVVAAVAVVAGVVELGKSLADLTSRFLEWLVVTGLAERAANLQREAWTGSEASAAALGRQLDALAGKVTTSREELQALGGELVRSLSGTQASGQGIVDTFNAVAQASAAMGAQAGSALKSIIERAKLFGRVQINPFELQGTGLKFQDVAASLAKHLGISVAAAQQQLFQGRTKINDAAAAIRDAVEKRFGEVNAKLRLGDVIGNLKKRLDELTKGINWEPLLQGIEQVSRLFDQSTVGGSTLKALIEAIGNTLGPAFSKAVPIARLAFLELELGALKVWSALLDVRDMFREAFKGHEDVVTMADALALVDVYLSGIADGAVNIVHTIGSGFVLAARAAFFLSDAAEKVRAALGVGWAEIGRNIVRGIVDGVTGGKAGLLSAMLSLGDAAKDAFKKALGIQSPSKEFYKEGKQIPAGAAGGVRAGAPDVQRAVDEMAPSPTPAAAAGAPGGGGGRGAGAPQVVVHFTVQIMGGGDPQATAKALESESLMAKLTKTIEDACATLGIPVQTGATS